MQNLLLYEAETMHEMPTKESLEYLRSLGIALPSDSLVQRLWRLITHLPGRRLALKALAAAVKMPGKALAILILRRK